MIRDPNRMLVVADTLDGIAVVALAMLVGVVVFVAAVYW